MRKLPSDYKRWLGPLAALLLLLLALQQWLALNQLGQRWQRLPYQNSASALADFAEFQALRALTAEDSDAQQQLVTELSQSPFVLGARLYDGGGRLLAAVTPNKSNNSRVYVRAIYQQERIAGFLQLNMASAALNDEQVSIWRRIYQHLSWLLPLTSALGALLVFTLLRLRRPSDFQ
ncbi:hypothetical protein [Oceanimonas sp. CAM02]|uniref:hypothetical protein n=1 Tax=Oceanimonas sp. CAM02 TaxID=3080336 RepID=UPI002935ACC8|nr:hypothetical protein [Oceanimonas sp. CAM02]MDV2859028.1 hypothetical protein [Oceanimonas sp. CAM02]